ncbi:asparagine synthase (glutamine-hydrolyzing) [Fontibacillus solani]|uniref:asparagine synthase (glutamine-hydrolyzing) n=1 Tax=Fontibacillus solani TaxID=1572857 RepID=A0A7W3SYR7_9BACL|nr:asparagine synthase (glutamine-hydrolyzing) [Fontibacillus solani]
MCGIFGIMYFDDIGYDLLNEKIKRMSTVSKHRGLDQSEVYVANRVAIGMNRLSIIAPEESFAIQKHLSSRRYAVINGEITNYRHVKSILKNKPEHKCDSAVILPSYEEFGERFVEMLAGMFAIAIYDEESHSFQLWRDPLGIKPLYYYHSTKCVIFASEIKMIYAVLDNRPEIEFSAIDNILRYRLNPGRSTVFKGIQKVLPGETVLFKNKGISRHRYWSLRPNEKVSSNKYCVEEFRELFGQVIRENSHADVPGGFFTSGGLDSSLVTAVAL